MHNGCLARAIILDPSKAIDCINNYLILAKMAAYGVNFNDFKLIFPPVKKGVRTLPHYYLK